MLQKLILLLVLAVQFICCKSFNPMDYNDKGEYEPQEMLSNYETVTNGTFRNKLDHFNQSNPTTWNQRYWKDDQFSHFPLQTGGPNFLYICGEWKCSKANTRTVPMVFGASKNAMIWSLEHRFYGESQPMPDFTVESLKWLNTTQALADIAYFIEEQNKTTPGPWIVIGGSYPGALVGWFKNVYPNHAQASWSSSGVINPIENFKMFDTDIYLSTQISSANCPKQINLMTSDIERKLKYGNDTVKLATFNAITFRALDDASKLPNIGDFMWYISDIFTMGVQYGGRVEMCVKLTDGTFWDNSTSSYNYTRFAVYADARGVKIEDYDALSLANTAVNLDNAIRQWTWQYCTEFGWFQEPNEQYPTRSQLLTHEYWLDYCKRIFSMDLDAPAIGYAHSYYGNTAMNASHIVFNNAIEDPWQYAGMRSIPYPSYQTELFANLINCTGCAHCVDIKIANDTTDAQSLKDARQNTIDHISKWLGWSTEKEEVKELEFLQD